MKKSFFSFLTLKNPSSSSGSDDESSCLSESTGNEPACSAGSGCIAVKCDDNNGQYNEGCVSNNDISASGCIEEGRFERTISSTVSQSTLTDSSKDEFRHQFRSENALLADKNESVAFDNNNSGLCLSPLIEGQHYMCDDQSSSPYIGSQGSVGGTWVGCNSCSKGGLSTFLDSADYISYPHASSLCSFGGFPSLQASPDSRFQQECYCPQSASSLPMIAPNWMNSTLADRTKGIFLSHSGAWPSAHQTPSSRLPTKRLKSKGMAYNISLGVDGLIPYNQVHGNHKPSAVSKSLSISNEMSIHRARAASTCELSGVSTAVAGNEQRRMSAFAGNRDSAIFSHSDFKWKNAEILGKGRSSVVYRVVHKHSKLPVAIKEIQVGCFNLHKHRKLDEATLTNRYQLAAEIMTHSLVLRCGSSPNSNNTFDHACLDRFTSSLTDISRIGVGKQNLHRRVPLSCPVLKGFPQKKDSKIGSENAGNQQQVMTKSATCKTPNMSLGNPNDVRNGTAVHMDILTNRCMNYAPEAGFIGASLGNNCEGHQLTEQKIQDTTGSAQPIGDSKNVNHRRARNYMSGSFGGVFTDTELERQIRLPTFILPFLGAYRWMNRRGGCVHIVLEWMSIGSLADFLRAVKLVFLDDGYLNTIMPMGRTRLRPRLAATHQQGFERLWCNMREKIPVNEVNCFTEDSGTAEKKKHIFAKERQMYLSSVTDRTSSISGRTRQHKKRYLRVFNLRNSQSRFSKDRLPKGIHGIYTKGGKWLRYNQNTYGCRSAKRIGPWGMRVNRTFIRSFFNHHLQFCMRKVRDSRVPEKYLKLIAFQLLDGVAFFHFNNCIHRDIKPHNILLSDKGIVKLADFGICRILKETPDDQLTFVGTQLYIHSSMNDYRSPERLFFHSNELSDDEICDTKDKRSENIYEKKRNCTVKPIFRFGNSFRASSNCQVVESIVDGNLIKRKNLVKFWAKEKSANYVKVNRNRREISFMRGNKGMARKEGNMGVFKGARDTGCEDSISEEKVSDAKKSSSALEYSFGADIWAIGICIAEMAMFEHPYADGLPCDLTDYDVWKLLIKKLWGAYSQDFINFLACCLRVNPKHRASARSLLLHPWLLKGMSTLKSFSKWCRYIHEASKSILLKRIEDGDHFLYFPEIQLPSLLKEAECASHIKNVGSSEIPPVGSEGSMSGMNEIAIHSGNHVLQRENKSQQDLNTMVEFQTSIMPVEYKNQLPCTGNYRMHTDSYNGEKINSDIGAKVYKQLDRTDIVQTSQSLTLLETRKPFFLPEENNNYPFQDFQIKNEENFSEVVSGVSPHQAEENGQPNQMNCRYDENDNLTSSNFADSSQCIRQKSNDGYFGCEKQDNCATRRQTFLDVPVQNFGIRMHN